jgi:drug/metabolite transporter (DMT)-like permease
VSSLGITAGLATAVLWTATAVCFEAAMRRIGSLSVNVLRLVVAALLFVGLSLWRTGHCLPQGLAGFMWRDLTLSGLVGFVVGDLMLFQAFVLIGGRLSMLIYASVPTMTAVAGFLFLGERISATGIIGMLVTSVGIGAAVFGKRVTEASVRSTRRIGILLAIGGSAGQAAGLLLGKHGAAKMDAFAATEIRVLAGLAGFLIVASLLRRLHSIGAILAAALGLIRSSDVSWVRSTRVALSTLTLGGIFGPFLGVSLGLLSAQLLPAGIASTLMSIVPVLLVPVSALVFRERVTVVEISGTLVALAGVALLAF